MAINYSGIVVNYYDSLTWGKVGLKWKGSNRKQSARWQQDPGSKLVHSVLGKINYGDLKHNCLYFWLVLPSGGWKSLITSVI